MGFALVCEEHVWVSSPPSAPCLLCLSPSLKMESKKKVCACVCAVCVFYCAQTMRCLKAFWTIIYLFMWICMKCHGMITCVHVCALVWCLQLCSTVCMCVCVCVRVLVVAGMGEMERGAENAASCWACWLFLLFADKRQLSLLSNPSYQNNRQTQTCRIHWKGNRTNFYIHKTRRKTKWLTFG